MPRSLARAIRRGGFEIRIDHGFEAVIRACAEPTPGRPRTWLNETLIGLYVELARDGFAHSVEVWRDGELAGGLYGLALGGAFFGESMFSRVRIPARSPWSTWWLAYGPAGSCCSTHNS